MRTTRVLLGVALIVAGTAGGLSAARTMLGDQARAQAALLASANREAENRAVATDERHSVEERVAAAVRLEPLEAALQARVDGATLVDLFDNEDWWRPYRADLPIVRVVTGDRVLAARGPGLGTAADSVVALARKQPVGSGIVTVGAQSYAVAAARLPGSGDRDAVLLIGRSIIATAAAAPGVTAGGVGHFGDKPWMWALALGVCLGGIGLVVTGRRRPDAGSVVAVEVPHEPTSRFGTPSQPRTGVGMTSVRTNPELAKGRMTDGGGVSIRHPAAGSMMPAVALAPAPAPAPVGVGSIFGRYRLTGRLGEGGMSELFVAEAAGVEGFSRSFVLKRLRAELARDKEAVAQFIDEARNQAGLVHSNIVPVFDFGVVGGEYFMTQEYIVGRDLGRLVARYDEHHRAGLPETMAYYIAHETLLALAYAHERRDKSGSPLGIVHRDISAGNVMVSLNGEVKLSDFGIVKSNRRVSRTQVGMVKGNANFMSPEQARGQTVDHRSDLFSLAHVLYYALTGQLLYTGENDLDVLYRAANGITPEDLALIRALPDPAASILEKALALDPAERFQSATEFADALAAHASAGKGATARLMQQLFGDELHRQTSSEAGVG